MINRLLRTKPIIVFFIVFIIPVLIILVNEQIGKYLLYGLYYIWIIALGLNFPETKKERKHVIIYTILTISIIITALVIFTYNNSIIYEPYYEKVTAFTFGFFILHLLVGTITFIKTLIFISKKIINYNSDTYELTIYLFGLIFYPIGIWLLQDKISKALDKVNKNTSQHTLKNNVG
ncbi:MAG: hypothetical protein KAT68_06715 [Bacteroidales bacterium]|nr:hypothetical protein [Bacteroidales bacterium]